MKERTCEYFKEGDRVIWRGESALANGITTKTVIEIQPDNGIGGAVICNDQDKKIEAMVGKFVPLVCSANEIKKFRWYHKLLLNIAIR